MSDILKYVVLALVVVSVLSLIVIGLNGLQLADVQGGFVSALHRFTDSFSDVIRSCRAFFNLIAGSPIPVTVMLFSCIVIPVVKYGIKIATVVYSWIFK